MSQEPLRMVVPTDDQGRRLDRFLTGQLQPHTRSFLTRLIRQGQVAIDERPVTKPGRLLREGERVSVELPQPRPIELLPSTIPLEIAFEDEALIVVRKAAGMVVHPGHGCQSGTLVQALLGRATPLALAGGTQRPGIVHRLDRGTSGLIVVAKTDAAYRALARAFAARLVEKRYVALVWGHPRPESGTIERAIGRSRANAVKMAVAGTRGRNRPARSDYRTLESLPGFGLLEVFPRTGRTHQIRVHLQSIHHSLVGDDRYGGRAWRGIQNRLKRDAVRNFERLALHASDLAFAHPTTGHQLRLHAPLPREFEHLLDLLRCP